MKDADGASAPHGILGRGMLTSSMSTINTCDNAHMMTTVGSTDIKMITTDKEVSNISQKEMSLEHPNTATNTMTSSLATSTTADLSQLPDVADVLEGSDLSSVESEMLDSDSDCSYRFSSNCATGNRNRSHQSDTKEYRKNDVFDNDSDDDSYFSGPSSLSEGEHGSALGLTDSSDEVFDDDDDDKHSMFKHESKVDQYRSNMTLATEADKPKSCRKKRHLVTRAELVKSTASADHKKQDDAMDTDVKHCKTYENELIRRQRLEDTFDDESDHNGRHKRSSTLEIVTGRRRGRGRGGSSGGPGRRRREIDITRPNHRDRTGRTPIFRCIADNDLHGLKRLLNAGADVNIRDNAGWTPLHEACIYGNIDIVRCLIEHHAEVNASGCNGETPLHDAARRGWLDVVEVLLQAGAKPSCTNNSGQRPVDVCDEHPAIQNLLKQRLHLQKLTTTCDRAGRTMLHRACARNQFPEVLDLLNCGADVHARDNAGWTPLHEAALKGHVAIARLLLAHGADPNALGYGGDTPLHDASQNEHVEVVQLLLDSGADPRIKNEAGESPLDVTESSAIRKLLDDAIDHWQKHGGVTSAKQSNTGVATSTRDVSPFWDGTTINTTSTSKSNKYVDADDIDVDDKAMSNGAGKKQRARSASQASDLKYTLSDDEASGGTLKKPRNSTSATSQHRRQVSMPVTSTTSRQLSPASKRNTQGLTNETKDGDTRRKQRAYRSQSPTTHRLQSASLGSSTLGNREGQPLTREERKAQQVMETFRRLEERSRKKRLRKARERSDSPHDSATPTPMQICNDSPSNGSDINASTCSSSGKRKPGRSRCSSQALSSSSTAADSKSAAADTTETTDKKKWSRDTAELVRRARQRDSSGRTALHRRAKYGDVEKAMELIKHGADVNACDNAGWTPLHEAALAGYVDLVRLLLQHGADVSKQASNLDTPLHDAIEAGHVEIVRILLESGASPDIANENGQTAFSLVGLDDENSDIGDLDEEQQEVVNQIKQLLTAFRAQRRQSSNGDENKQNSHTETTDGSNPQPQPVSKRKRRLVCGRQLQSLKSDEIKTNSTTASTTVSTTATSPTVSSQSCSYRQPKRSTTSTQASIDDGIIKTEESDTSMMNLLPAKDALQLRSTSLSWKSESITTSIPPHIKTEDETTHVTSTKVDLAHAKRYLPLYTVQLDVSDTYGGRRTGGNGMDSDGRGDMNSGSGGTNGFFVIDVQVCLLLNISGTASLFACYPDLQRRAVGQREKERFWGPLACMLMNNLTQSPFDLSNITSEFKEQEKRRFLSTDVYFIRLDDVANIIRRDYPSLSEQLITIKLDLSYSDDLCSNKTEEKQLTITDVPNCDTAKSLSPIRTPASPILPVPPISPVSPNIGMRASLPTSSSCGLPVKLAMKLQKQAMRDS